MTRRPGHCLKLGDDINPCDDEADGRTLGAGLKMASTSKRMTTMLWRFAKLRKAIAIEASVTLFVDVGICTSLLSEDTRAQHHLVHMLAM